MVAIHSYPRWLDEALVHGVTIRSSLSLATMPLVMADAVAVPDANKGHSAWLVADHHQSMAEVDQPFLGLSHGGKMEN